MHPMHFEDSSVTMHPMHFEPAARTPPKQKGPVQRFVRTRAEQQPLTPSSKGTSQRCGVLVASCAISTGPRPSLTPPRCGTRDPRAPGLCSAGGSTRHSCGGPLLLTRWRAVARCADGSSALQALLSVGRVQPCHSQFTRLLRAEYFLWRRRMQTGCTRLAVKQWPGIGALGWRWSALETLLCRGRLRFCRAHVTLQDVILLPWELRSTHLATDLASV